MKFSCKVIVRRGKILLKSNQSGSVAPNCPLDAGYFVYSWIDGRHQVVVDSTIFTCRRREAALISLCPNFAGPLVIQAAGEGGSGIHLLKGFPVRDGTISPFPSCEQQKRLRRIGRSVLTEGVRPPSIFPLRSFLWHTVFRTYRIYTAIPPFPSSTPASLVAFPFAFNQSKMEGRDEIRLNWASLHTS